MYLLDGVARAAIGEWWLDSSANTLEPFFLGRHTLTSAGFSSRPARVNGSSVVLNSGRSRREKLSTGINGVDGVARSQVKRRQQGKASLHAGRDRLPTVYLCVGISALVTRSSRSKYWLGGSSGS